MNTNKIVLASANAHKVAEIVQIFSELMPEVELVPRPSLDVVGDVDEDADTLVGNAKLKAVALMQATRMPALADDTGLFVRALGGAPGVRSARFAADENYVAHTTDKDRANRLLLLEKMRGITDRHAEFRSVMVIAWPDGDFTVAEGVLPGVISTEERGGNGFGYDAVFMPEVDDVDDVRDSRDSSFVTRTYAEMDDVTKNSISHRRRAVEALIAELKK